MHVRLSQNIKFHHLKHIYKCIFPPRHWNNTVSYFSFYPHVACHSRQTLLGYPLLGLSPWLLGPAYTRWTCVLWVGLPSRAHMVSYFFYTIIILALLFKHIFKPTFKYVQSSPLPKPSLLGVINFFIMTCLKQVCLKQSQTHMYVWCGCISL